MINDTEYTKKILKHFGIEDVDITSDLIFEKINATPKERTYNTIDEIPYNVAMVHSTCDWFYKKYLKGRV